jgi:hypothetical protein
MIALLEVHVEVRHDIRAEIPRRAALLVDDKLVCAVGSEATPHLMTIVSREFDSQTVS